MDRTIRPATAEEKFEAMKQKLIAKGEWTIEEENRLRLFYGVPMPEKSVEEIIGTPEKVEKKKPVKKSPRRKKAKK